MKKIMFNDRYGLTQAVLSGKKTQTRRIVPNGTPLGSWKDIEKKSKYKVGEVVVVAQGYEDAGISFINIKESMLQGKKTGIRRYGFTKHMAGRTNKMFVCADVMPHQIRITDVRVERLQDISDEDCFAEGIRDYSTPTMKRFGVSDFKKETIRGFRTPKEAYAFLIDKISGKGTWESNPWVFSYTFELVK